MSHRCEYVPKVNSKVVRNLTKFEVGILMAASFLLTAVSTLGIRRYALRRNLLDFPNDRSSHRVPTPHGAGIAIALVTLLGSSIVAITVLRSPQILAAYVGGGVLVAVIGHLDDCYQISAAWRFLVHCLAAVFVLLAVPLFPSMGVLGFDVVLTTFGTILAGLFIVWLLNLYNFMDGIDGIAGVETFTVSAPAAVLLWRLGHNDYALLTAILAPVSLGFLIWNWPPARIFMGDAGSGFIGFCFGALSVWTFAESALSIFVWLILLGIFLVDATVTLLRRVARGDLFYKAHRSHAYQHASRTLGSHSAVTAAVGLINVCWLMPIAAFVASGRLEGLTGLVISYTPLLGLVLYFGAGAEETRAH